MSDELVQIVHPDGSTHHIRARVLPGWKRLGWRPAADTDAAAVAAERTQDDPVDSGEGEEQNGDQP